MEATLSSYNPTWRDKLATWMMGDGQASTERRAFVGGLLGSTGLGNTGVGVVDATPAGGLLGLQEAAQSGDKGGMALAAAGLIPGAGVAEKVVAKTAERAAPAAERFITAYHGSPHSFDKFDLSKIGTGEGAQAYGHGLYFADSEDVAKSYRDDLSRKIIVDGKTLLDRNKIVGSTGNKTVDDVLLAHGGDVDKAIAENSDWLDQKEIEILHGLKGKISSEAPGSMYQVRIKADPEHFLDWDKPLSEQSPHVLDRLGLNNSQRDFDLEAKLQYGSPEYEAYMKRIDSRIGAPHNPDVTGAEWYRDDLLRGGHEAERGRSAYLASQGIPGIKYLDQGSRGAGEGSRNYVVFDDSMVEILKKYGLVGLLGGSAAYGSSQQQPQGAPTL